MTLATACLARSSIVRFTIFVAESSQVRMLGSRTSGHYRETMYAVRVDVRAITCRCHFAMATFLYAVGGMACQAWVEVDISLCSRIQWGDE
jgi:hypothetical protein